MNYRQEENGRYLISLDIGDEIIEALTEFADSAGVASGQFTGIGALDSAELGYFDNEKREYLRKKIEGQREILSLIGNLAAGPGGEPILHAHIILGDPDFRLSGGHLFSGRISVTGEIYFRPTSDLERTPNSETGLNLWNLER